MISSVIIDDEEVNRDTLRKLLDLFLPSVEVIGVASNITEAKLLIEEKKPDLIFLDVEMPGGSGFDLLESLEKTDFRVVFTTAHAIYAIKAIKYAAMDYLLKPIDLIELKSAVQKCIDLSQERTLLKKQIDVLKNNREGDNFTFNKIAVRAADGLEFIDAENIIRCEADRPYCKFYLVGNENIVVSQSISEYEDILTQGNFIKVHKSSIVNPAHVIKFIKGKGGSLVMSDDSVVKVAVSRKEELLRVLNK
ncbi:response regulator transcription factor [Crocinitomix catalasitica]|nr:response regulator transcription factor [Crocinitomix catalasitica]